MELWTLISFVSFVACIASLCFLMVSSLVRAEDTLKKLKELEERITKLESK